MPGWCLFVATFGPSQGTQLMRRKLDGSGVSGERAWALQAPTVKSPLATAYREKPTMGPQIPSESGRGEGLDRWSGTSGNF